MIELPTTTGPVWVNPAHVVVVKPAEEGRTFLYVQEGQYTIEMPVDQVVAALAGQAPPTVQVATT